MKLCVKWEKWLKLIMLPNVYVLAASQDLISWFTVFVNYLASHIIPSNFSFNQTNKFIYHVKIFVWDEPYLYKICADGMIRRC